MVQLHPVEGQSGLDAPVDPLQLKRRLVSGGFWALGAKIGSVVFAVGVNALLARLLSIEEMGAYFLILSVVTAAALIVRGGLEQTSLRLVAESIGLGALSRARSAVAKVFLLVTASAIVVGGFLWIFGWGLLADFVFQMPVMAAASGLITLWVIAMAYQMLIAQTFRGFNDVRLASIFGGLATSFLSALFFASVWLTVGQASLVTVLTITLGCTSLSMLLGLGLMVPKVRTIPAGGEPISFAEILSNAAPLLVVNLTFIIIETADIWLMGAFRGPEEVAIYGAARRLVLLISMAQYVANSAISPTIGVLHAQGQTRKLERWLRLTATLVSIPGTLVIVAFMLAGTLILELVFGPTYREGGGILIILAVGKLFVSLTGSCTATLVMAGYNRSVMWISLIAGAIGLGAAAAVVESHGGIGVAAAMATAAGFQHILMLIFARKLCGVWTHASPKMLAQSFRLLFRYARRD